MSSNCRSMFSATLMWNCNPFSKPTQRKLRSTSLADFCNISSALTAKTVTLPHTSQNVTATHCRASITFSTTKLEKSCAYVFCLLIQHCSHTDEDLQYKCGHHSADRTLCTRFSEHRDGSFANFTPVHKFGLCSCDDVKSALNRRTHVDEARRACTEYGIGLAPLPSCGLRVNSVKACALSVRKLVPGVPSGEHPWPFLSWSSQIHHSTDIHLKTQNAPHSYVHLCVCVSACVVHLVLPPTCPCWV